MKKFWNGVLAFGPLVCFLISIGCMVIPEVIVLLFAIYSTAAGKEPNEAGFAIMAVVFTVMLVVGVITMFLFVIWTIADIVVFCIYALKNPRLDDGGKALWCCLLIALQFFVFPVYWWIYIRREQPNNTSVTYNGVKG
ncbi:MAG: hypothetical protein IJ397_04820 [Lachnospiraceae bacterium]|nr:hypothetical protein [Lachnospiraceae bacterium]